MLAGALATRVAFAGPGAVLATDAGAQATTPARTAKRPSDWRVLCPQGVVIVVNDRLRPFSDCFSFAIHRRSVRHPARGRLFRRFSVSPRRDTVRENRDSIHRAQDRRLRGG